MIRRFSHRRITGSHAAPPAICRITARMTIAGIPAMRPGMMNANGEGPGSAGVVGSWSGPAAPSEGDAVVEPSAGLAEPDAVGSLEACAAAAAEPPGADVRAELSVGP